jgi:excinuclease ABC subunit A
MDKIFVKGAKENNLKNIDVTIPRDKLVVFTGLSGSGKSSLAFDTIFAEGQRRYIESLSSYARMFLGQMEKPNVEFIEGLSPAVSIDQKTTSHNPRSTVGTVTEIYDYLRLLYARVGVPHCPNCGKEISQQTVDQICDKVLELKQGKVQVLAPVVRGRKGEYSKMFQGLKKNGYLRVRVDGNEYMLDEEIELDKNIKHNISVVIDRLIIKEGVERRLADSVEQALKLAEGLVVIDFDRTETLFSTKYSCPDCDISMGEIEPRLFSFNNPFGACPECGGLGYRSDIDLKLLIRDENLSINEGAIATVSGWTMDNSRIAEMGVKALAKHFSLDTPFKDLPDDVKQMIFFGNDEKMTMEYSSNAFKGSYMAKFEGIASNLMRRYQESSSDAVKHEIEKFMQSVPCTVCGGKRLNKNALSVTVGGFNIADICDLSVVKLYDFFEGLKLSNQKMLIAGQIIKEIKARLNFLINVGLEYLTLSRTAGTLSGGESQRIRLATQIGSGLTGVLYILDEPSIGLHQKDNERLLGALKGLRDLGNTLLVVEHDEETIRNADFIVDIGPGAGVHGGELVVSGSLQDVINCPNSITGKYLSGELKIEVPKSRKQLDGRYLAVKGAKQNNLKNIDVNFPVGLITAVTGVSGSGKSSLVNGVVFPTLSNALNGSRLKMGNYDQILGIENLTRLLI